MNYLKLFSFIALSISCLLASCTIEKRVYFSGYHVEWKNRSNHSNEQQAASGSNKIKKIEGETAVAETPVGKLITASADDHPVLEKEKVSLWAADSKKSTIAESSAEYVTAPFWKKESTPAVLKGDGRRLNGFALFGFICFILGHIPLLLSLLLWPLGIIFSIIGLYKIKKHPDRWNGKGLANTVLIIATVEIILALALLLLLFLLFPSGIGAWG